MKARNPVVGKIVEALAAKKKAVTFDEFVNTAVEITGHLSDRDGIDVLFNHYDKQGKGYLDIDDMKVCARDLG